MTANISQVTDKNIPPSPEILSALYIWTLPEALKNRSILLRTLSVPTFHPSRGQEVCGLLKKDGLASLLFWIRRGLLHLNGAGPQETASWLAHGKGQMWLSQANSFTQRSIRGCGACCDGSSPLKAKCSFLWEDTETQKPRDRGASQEICYGTGTKP